MNNTLIEFTGGCQAVFIITWKILSKLKVKCRSRVSPIRKLEGVEIATAVLHVLKISIQSYNTDLFIHLFFFLHVLDNFSVNFIFIHFIYNEKEQCELFKSNNKPLAWHQGHSCFMYF